MRLTSLILISLFVISACVPNAVTYYFPSADGGEVRAKHCVPTESLLDIKIESTHESIKIRAYANEGKNFNSVYLGFSGESWDEIYFTSTNFRIVDLENQSTISVSSVFAVKHDGFSELDTEPYAAPHAHTVIDTVRFSIQVRLPEPMPEDFELFIPPIMIDDDEIRIPVIRFERKLWMGISPFNC